jgi:hypothetical protein
MYGAHNMDGMAACGLGKRGYTMNIHCCAILYGIGLSCLSVAVILKCHQEHKKRDIEYQANLHELFGRLKGHNRDHHCYR